MKTNILILLALCSIAAISVPPLPKSSDVKQKWVDAATIREAKIVELQAELAKRPANIPVVGISILAGTESNLLLTAVFNGESSNVVRVDLTVNGLVLPGLTSSPWSIKWLTPAVAGKYSIIAQATLNTGVVLVGPATVIEVVKP